ncbi:EAL domain-containing protein [Sphingobium sp. CFD-2]|uniref:EAL domain-containing protein n=1 Tax=Sphingobium sp. CFD-2 TaxID=2878542 RepID=UPI00214C10E0|nr:EAL domain-containing protein [Sphingobium sp. CFD-2]
MDLVEKGSSYYLLAVRLNNYSALGASYGGDLARAALQQVRRRLERHLGNTLITSVDDDKIILIAHNRLLESYAPKELIEILCTIVSTEPFRFEDHAVLLDICAAYRPLDVETSPQCFEALVESVTAELASAMARGFDGRILMSAKEEGRYRADMKRCVTLLEQIRGRTAFYVWRPVVDPRDQGRILYYDGRLRHANKSGQQLECDAALTAFERLGLSHIIDLQLVSDVLDELRADPLARLSIPIASASLDAHLLGPQAGWNEIFARLQREPALGPRLILEIADKGDLLSVESRGVLGLLRTFGVRIAVGRFGGGSASLDQLAGIAPEIIRIDSGFLRTAHQSERSRARIGPLLNLARTIAPCVVLDGVETSWHLMAALEEAADWVAGSFVGGTSIGRDWVNLDYGDAVTGLGSFHELFGEHPDAAAGSQLTAHYAGSHR